MQTDLCCLYVLPKPNTFVSNGCLYEWRALFDSQIIVFFEGSLTTLNILEYKKSMSADRSF